MDRELIARSYLKLPVPTAAEGLLTRPLFNVPFMGPKMGARSTLLGHVCRSLPLRGNSS